jgi:hypothetical protein
MFFKKKQQNTNHGISTRSITAYSLIQCVCTPLRQEAITHYRKKVEVGTDLDNPSRPFPEDGRFKWATPKQHASRIIYYAGQMDEAWIAEKKQNHEQRTNDSHHKPPNSPLFT